LVFVILFVKAFLGSLAQGFAVDGEKVIPMVFTTFYNIICVLSTILAIITWWFAEMRRGQQNTHIR